MAGGDLPENGRGPAGSKRVRAGPLLWKEKKMRRM